MPVLYNLLGLIFHSEFLEIIFFSYSPYVNFKVLQWQMYQEIMDFIFNRRSLAIKEVQGSTGLQPLRTRIDYPAAVGIRFWNVSFNPRQCNLNAQRKILLWLLGNISAVKYSFSISFTFIVKWLPKAVQIRSDCPLSHSSDPECTVAGPRDWSIWITWFCFSCFYIINRYGNVLLVDAPAASLTRPSQTVADLTTCVWNPELKHAPPKCMNTLQIWILLQTGSTV